MTRPKAVRCVAGATAALAIILPGQAFAAFSPKTTVSSNESGTTTISYVQGASDDPVGRVTFFMPYDIFANTGQPQGGAVGTATAKGDTGSFTGVITAQLAADTVTTGGVAGLLSDKAAACSGLPSTGAAPPAYWVINLTGGGATIQVPIYVYPIFASDVLVGDFFIQRMVICAPTTGVKLQELTLNIEDALSITPGWDVWHTLAVPFASGTTNLNATGAAENEAQDRTPHEVTLAAKKGKSAGTVAVAGHVKQGGKTVAGATVEILAGKKVVGSVKTKKGGGRYNIVVTTNAKTLVARATVDARALPSCVRPLFGAPTCTATVGGFTATSDPATVS
jgi:hypothetical protein